MNTVKAAVKYGLLLSLFTTFNLMTPASGSAQCTPAPTGSTCQTGNGAACMNAGVDCQWIPSMYSWANMSAAGAARCVVEATKPGAPPNGYYNTMNCNNNTWTLTCDVTYTPCSNTTCVSNITIPFCTTVNQCTARCTTCNGGYTTCDAGLSCEANITLPNCATVNQCTDLCTVCNTGYELVGGYCVGTTLKLSKNSVKANKDLTNSSEPAIIYVTSDGRVGVSTGNPQYMIHIASGAGETATLLAVSTGSTNLFWVDGFGAHASKFFMNGADLTDLNASNLTSGTVPLARLYGITKDQLSATAGILDTQLDTLSTAGKVSDSALSANVSLLDANQTATGIKTFASSVTVTGLLGAPRVELAPGVAVSSEALADLGAGVRISSNIYIVGFASATKYYGDGSALVMGGAGSGLDSDTLDLLDSLDFVRRTGAVSEAVTGAKTFTSSVTVTAALGAPRLELADNVAVSSEALADLGGGVMISSNVYVVGFASAAKFFGDASALTLNASNLASGTVPLGRLSGITNAEIAAAAGILDSQLATISTAGKVADSAFSQNVSLLDRNEAASGIKTFTSSVTVTGVLGTPRIELAANVAVSSEASSALGGGVTISSNVYIIGFASATKYYGDGSDLVMGGAGSGLDADTLDTLDSLDFVNRTGSISEEVTGVKTFTSSMTVTAALGAQRFELGSNVSVSSEALADLGGGVRISSNIYIVGFASATKFYGDATALVLNASNLTSGTVPLGRLSGITNAEIAAAAGILDTQLAAITTAGKVLDSALSSNVSLLDANQAAAGIKTFTSSVTVAGVLGAPRLELAENVAVSSEALADLGAGVRISSNVYIVGFASATKYYGDGSSLTMGGAGSGLDADKLDTLDSLDFVRRTGNISEGITGAKTFTSSMTVTSALGAPRLELADNVAISSEALAALGGGVTISTNVNIAGFASAAKFYGDGSALTALNASNLASGTVPLAQLSGITNVELAAAAGILDTQLAAITTAGKVLDSALSSNVSLLDANQSVAGIKTFTSSITVAGVLGAPRLELAENVAVSSESLAGLGAGVRISSNVYIVGFASATKYFGDGSSLTMGGAGSGLDADRLDLLDSTDFVRRTGNISDEINGAKTFTSSMTVTAPLGAPRFELADNVAISSEALAALGGGVTISTNVNIAGFASAARYYGSGADLTALNASNLASGTVPLAQLSGITNVELAAAAAILDTQLETISTAGKVLDSALSSNVSLLDASQTATGLKTFTGKVTMTAALDVQRVELAANVAVSSESLAGLGAGVRISSNVYIVGFASATKYFGDGSSLTMGGAGSGLDADRLDLLDSTDFVRRTGNLSEEINGAKTFTSSMTVTTALGAPRYELAEGVAVSSESLADMGGGVRISSNVYVVGFSSAAKYYGDASALILNASNLASGTVPLARLSGITTVEIAPAAGILDTQLAAITTAGKVLDSALTSNVSLLSANQTVTGIKTFASTVTVAGLLGAPRLELAPNVAVSSESLAGLGAGVRISSNVYIVGFASATKYFGDGSSLTMGGAGSGLDADRLDLLDSTDFVRRTGDISEAITGAKTFTSSTTVTTALGAPRFELADSVAISSESLADLGGGVRISSNMYVVGFSSAAKYYGDGSALILNAANLASGTVPLARLSGITTLEIAPAAGIQDTQLASITTAGKVLDSALTSNVSLLNANQTVAGIKTFASTVTVAGVLGVPRVELAPDVAVSSESLAGLGAGVRISSNVYIVGFASATKYFGDGSSLTMGGAGSGLDADRLDLLDSTDFVRRTGNISDEINGAKTFTSSMTVTAALGAPRYELAEGVSVSSESLPALGGGVRISSNVYVVGFSSAAKYYGDGSALTSLNAANLASGTVPLARLSGITTLEIAPAAGILDTQLAAITTAGKVLDSALTSNVSLLNANQTATGIKTFTSSVTVAGLLGAPRLELAPNVAVSSESLAGLGAGVRISSNVYIVGFASATKYFGDGSSLTMGGAGSGLDADRLDLLDSLDFVRRTGTVSEPVTGAKTFTSSMTVTTALGAPRFELADKVVISSEALAALGGGVSISTNVNIAGFVSAVRYYGSGTDLTALNASNLASGTVPLAHLSGITSTEIAPAAGILDTQLAAITTAGKIMDSALSSNVSLLDGNQTVTGIKTFTSRVTMFPVLGVPRVELDANVAVSSEASAALGRGVTISSNVYIVGFASATKYYGDGSSLVMGGAGSGLDSDTLDLLDSLDFVRRTGTVSEPVTGAKTFTSSMTVTMALGAPRFELADSVAISSEALAALGGGVRISSNVYVTGFSSAAKYYGDGSALTSLNAANLASGTVPLARLSGITSLEIAPAAGILDTQLATITTAGKVLDSALTANVSLLNGNQLATGIKTFTSSVTVAGVLGVPRIELAANVTVSSEASAALGRGVTISSNVYIVGFASATKYYGDGSSLVMGGAGSGLDADRLDLLDSTDFVRRTGNISDEISGAKTFTSSMTVTTALGAPRFELAGSVAVSSEALAALGGGVRISSNVYVVGFSSAAKYYGDGSALTSLNASNLAGGTVPLARLSGITNVEIAPAAGILDTQLATISTGGKVLDSALTANVSLLNGNQTVTGIKTFASTVTVAAVLGVPRLELAGKVAISSETQASLGGGVTISSNVYIIGFASATKYYGDGSALVMGGAGSGLDADRLDLLDSLDFVRRTGAVSEPVTGAKTFTSSMTVTTALGAPRFELADNVAVSSETQADLGGGLRISSNVYVVGFASAAKYYGEGSELTYLNASNLAGGTVPLARLSGITNLEISATAGILDTQLATISTSGKILDSALTSNVSLLDGNQVAAGIKTFTSSMTVTGALGAPRLELADNVAVSSEALASLGGGVRISSNIFIVGFSSAARYYGDGSQLTGVLATGLGSGGVELTAEDFIRKTGDLTEAVTGLKTFLSSMTVYTALGVPRVELADNVAVSSEALGDLGGGVRISSNVYIVGFASAPIYYGDGSQLTGIGSLGAGVNADTLDFLDSTDFVRATDGLAQTITGPKTFTSSATVTTRLGTPRIELADNVSVSSEPLASLGGGVTISSNVYIIGFASATKYYGDGSALVMGGTGSGLDADKLDTLDSPDFVRRTGAVNEEITGAKTFTSSTTVTTALGAPRFELAGNVAISSESLAALGAGVRISSNVYIVGFASAPVYYGDGSKLTGVMAENAALLDNLDSPDFVRRTGNVSEQVTGAKTFTSSMTATLALGAPRVELADGVMVSSETLASLGAGLRISSNVYIVGFASATKYFGDGSNLTGLAADDANLLDGLDSADFVRRTGAVNEEITGAKTFTSSVTATLALGVPRVELLPGVAVSSEASGVLGGGVRISSNVYIVGFTSAAGFYGDGAGLTNVVAESLGTGGDPLGAEDFVRKTGDLTEAITGIKTFLSSTTVTTALGSPRFEAALNVAISSEAQAGLGAGLRISSNVYIVGFASATKYFGDGSNLTMGGAGSGLDADRLDLLDSLDFVRRTGNVGEEITGTKTFTSSATITDAWGLAAARVRLANNVAVSSETSPVNGGGVRISSNVYIVGFASATKYYGDGSNLTGLDSAQNANFLDTLDSTDFVRRTGAVAEEITGAKTFTSSMTVTSAGGLGAARVTLANNVALSSAASPLNGGGVTVSSNVYIVGFASATKYYGDGSNLTGLDSAQNANFLDTLDSLDFVRRTGAVAEEITGAKTFTSSATITDAWGLAAARVRLANNVTLSSAASPLNGGGVTVSSNVYIVGFASATKYYGDGSNLTGLDSAQNANFLDNLDSTDFVRRTGNVAEEITGAKTFLSSTTITAALGAPRLELAGRVAISSEAAAGLGGGVTISSNVYVVGFASAAKYFGDGSALTSLSASNLASGTVPLARLSGITNVEIAPAAGLLDTQLATITTAGKVLDSALTSNVSLLDANQTASGIKTFTSSVTVAGVLGAPRLELSGKVAISSETLPSLGAGVTISSNVYIIGFASATKYYGDGSSLTMGGAGSGLDADKLDNLDSLDFVRRTGTVSEPVTGAKTFTSSMTVTTALGAPRLELAGNVAVSSEASALNGGGVRLSSNVYIVGFSSATRYYGDGSMLTGLDSAIYAVNSSKLFSTDAPYAYGSATPYYGYLTLAGARWRFKVSPNTPEGVEVAYADTAGDADTTDGLHAAAAGAGLYNDQPNQLVRTDAAGVLQAGWINTVHAGTSTVEAITRVYASDDSYLRHYSLANFVAQVRTAATGAWDITVTSAANLTGGAAGSLPYQSAPGTTAMLPASSGYLLKSGASAPAWSTALYDDGTRIGVGTAAPDQALTVAGNLSQTGVIISSGAGSSYFAGNLGVGVAAPTNKFEVASAAGSTLQFDTSNAGYVSIKVGGIEVARMKP